jgi:hypothetical protein
MLLTSKGTGTARAHRLAGKVSSWNSKFDPWNDGYMLNAATPCPLIARSAYHPPWRSSIRPLLVNNSRLSFPRALLRVAALCGENRLAPGRTAAHDQPGAGPGAHR